MELIIVDGYSEDKTLSILKESLNQTGLKHKIICENEGLGRARQIVVDNASGDYIVWVDGDMVMSRDFVRMQVEFMDHNPDVGIAKGKYETCIRTHHENLVATLETTEFILSTMFEGKTSSKTLGTSGCIYRVKAIKQVDGFDPHLKKSSEDIDAENRIQEAGWLLHVTNALFYETRRQTWRALWNEYFWHGQGNRHVFEKNKRIINLYKMLPPVAVVAEFLRVPAAYKLTRRKVVLLLPLHYVFKRIAWFLGFMNA
jgi:glycosyltransferase involved in cell wall biosynthesis